MCSLGERTCLYFTLNLLGRWDHLGLGLSQVERLKFCAFLLLLFLATF